MIGICLAKGKIKRTEANGYIRGIFWKSYFTPSCALQKEPQHHLCLMLCDCDNWVIEGDMLSPGSWDINSANTATSTPWSLSSLEEGSEVPAQQSWLTSQMPAPHYHPSECAILNVERPQLRKSRWHHVEQRSKIIHYYCVKPLKISSIR